MLLIHVVANDGVVDGYALQVEVPVVGVVSSNFRQTKNVSGILLGVIGIEEAISNVRNIKTRVRLASNVYIPVLESESGHEVFPEPAELGCQLNFISNIRGPLRISYSNRLLNPDHVC